MLHNVAVKTLHDQRRTLLAWCVGLLLLVAMYVAIYPSVRDNPSYSDLINKMPESIRSLFYAGGGGDLTSPAGYLYVELLSFMGPMLVLIYAIGAGSGAIAGEEDRHTLDLLLATPITRTRLLLEKVAAMLIGTVALVTVLWAALMAEGAAAGMHLSAGRVAATMVHLGLLGAVFGGLALLVGALTGRPGVSRAVPALVAVVAYLVNGLAPLVSWLKPIRPASPFYQYIAHDPIRHGLALSSVGVAVATVVALVALAVVAFRRRDIGT